jgi:hypothetical protein
VLLTLMEWGNRYLSGGEPLPATWTHTECGHELTPQVTCAHCAERVEPGTLTLARRDS